MQDSFRMKLHMRSIANITMAEPCQVAAYDIIVRCRIFAISEITVVYSGENFKFYVSKLQNI